MLKFDTPIAFVFPAADVNAFSSGRGQRCLPYARSLSISCQVSTNVGDSSGCSVLPAHFIDQTPSEGVRLLVDECIT